MAQSLGTSTGQVAAVATPSPLAVPASTPATGSQPAVPPAGLATSADTLAAAVDRINAYLAASDRSLQLSVDPQSHLNIVLVRDARTGAVIQQIPGEEALRLASRLGTDSHLLIDFTV